MISRVMPFVVVLAASCAAPATKTTSSEPAFAPRTLQTVPKPRAGVRTHEPSPPAIASENEARCAAGDPAGCHASALDHYYAPSSENDAIAMDRFRQACDAGYAPSCNGVGTMYAQGRAVEEDDAEAVRWFRLACGKDGSTGCEHLAEAYEHGRGVAKDLDAARVARERGRCLFEQSLHPDMRATCPAAP